MENYSVEGHADLARDPHTNSIINVNRLDYEQYVSRRATKEEKNRHIQTIEDEVANMKDDINEIKFLLKELLNGSR